MWWVRVRRWPDADASVQREFVAADHRSFGWGGADPLRPVTTPITHGLRAGSSLAQALSHGILEPAAALRALLASSVLAQRTRVAIAELPRVPAAAGRWARRRRGSEAPLRSNRTNWSEAQRVKRTPSLGTAIPQTWLGSGLRPHDMTMRRDGRFVGETSS